MKKRKIRCAALLLALTMMSDAALSVNATTMSSITSDAIKDMEAQINAAEDEKDALKGSISDLQKIKKELEALKGDLKSYVATLDANVVTMESNIAQLQTQIAEKEAEIAQTEAELLSAQDVASQQYDSMKVRIRLMYESNIVNTLWQTLATAGSLGDILNMADRINRIYAYDQQKWEEYQLSCEYIRLCKEQLELEKEILDGQKAAVEEEQNRIEELIEEKKQQILSYENDITDKEQSIREYEAELAEKNAIIEALEDAVAEEKKRILAENGLVLEYDGGAFVQPLASYTRVSSDYGWRIHPTLGYNKFHEGVDFAAPKGTAIYAAYDGVVIASAYNDTMGNYVMINHGNELYTIYMHASKLIAAKGEIVARGDKIAEVGTTGRSTGNHLHFGVRLNGSYVSPWKYLSR